MEMSRFLAELHPRLVQFPVVLLLAALLFDAVGLLFRNERAHWCGKVLMMAGVVSMLFAFICGINAEIWAARAGVPHDAIEWHEVLATAMSWGFMALLAWRLFLDGSRRGAMAAYVITGLSLYALFGMAAYLGGKLVFDYGAAVEGARANTILSVHDLNTLAERQTNFNLHYSEIMHHVSGWLVLVLSLTLLARALSPDRPDRFRWLGPALFLVGGCFLLVFADLDLYRLTDWRQFNDREVEMHKLISLILITLGIRGLLKKPAKSAAPEKGLVQGQYQNRLVAVMALIGGGLLFTHIHTVAPYADVAAGVYINHIVLGVVALAIGGVKLLDDAFPSRRRRRTVLFPSLLALEAVLLITYTEGLPWFIGYGHYNRWGVQSNCVAPYGPFRAELDYDPATAQMDVHVWDRLQDTPVDVPVTNVTVLVAQRYSESAVPLTAVDARDGRASHFRGSAPFLATTPAFCARLALPVAGRTQMGYFDPWVTKGISGFPPNVLAHYVCPMHEGMISEKPGACPICGMELLPIRLYPPKTLHNPKYDMTLAHAGAPVIAGQPALLTFTPEYSATGQTVHDLQIMHEHLLHLIVVSDDLTYFDHVHPQQQPDGSFTIRYTFPSGGNYLLYADIMPRDDWSQVFRLPLTVGGADPPDQALQPSPAPGREIDQYHVEMVTQPRELVAERESDLIFSITRNGQPVTDLQPYIGAMGHCVIISQDTQEYLHSHPTMFGKSPGPDDRGGPVVSFHTMFPKPGLYKVWGQFRIHDKIVVSDYVVEVQPSWLPRWLVRAVLFD